MTEEVMQLVEEDTDWASKNPAAVGWRIKEITGPMFARTPLKSPLNQKLISTIEVACLLYHLSMRFDAAAAFTGSRMYALSLRSGTVRRLWRA